MKSTITKYFYILLIVLTFIEVAVTRRASHLSKSLKASRIDINPLHFQKVESVKNPFKAMFDGFAEGISGVNADHYKCLPSGWPEDAHYSDQEIEAVDHLHYTFFQDANALLLKLARNVEGLCKSKNHVVTLFKVLTTDGKSFLQRKHKLTLNALLRAAAQPDKAKVQKAWETLSSRDKKALEDAKEALVKTKISFTALFTASFYQKIFNSSKCLISSFKFPKDITDAIMGANTRINNVDSHAAILLNSVCNQEEFKKGLLLYEYGFERSAYSPRFFLYGAGTGVIANAFGDGPEIVDA